MIAAREGTATEVRSVTAASGSLAGDSASSFNSAREIVLGWMSARTPEALPEAAHAGKSFSLELGNGEVVANSDLWAARFDTADELLRDQSGIERRWRTEIALFSQADATHFSVRLSVVTQVAGIPFLRTAPSLIGELATRIGANFDGRSGGQPIESVTGLELLELLQRKNRLPLLAISDQQGGSTVVDARRVARQLAGFAHVIRVSPRASREVEAVLGREWSVFGGAMRLYAADVEPASQDYRSHPLWLAKSVPSDPDERRRFIRRIVSRIFASSVSRSDLDEIAPSFFDVKRYLSEHQVAKARAEVLSSKTRVDAANSLAERVEAEAERLAALSEENAGLRQELVAVKAKLSEVSGEKDFAYESCSSLEAEIDRLKRQQFGVVAKARALEARLAAFEDRVFEVPLPDSLDELDDWATQYFPDRLVVLSKATRAAKKAVFEDHRQIYRCLIVLARQYVDMRRGLAGAGEAYAAVLRDERLEISGVGDALDDHRYREQFVAPYKSGQIELDTHLAPARGTSERGSRDPKRTYRIYFAWDEQDEMVVVGSLPAHLTTSLSD